MNVYLIRHGETISNKEKRYMGITDVPLSDEGIAKIKDKVYSNYYPEYDNQIIYTSSLSRTIETLKLIYGDVDFTKDPRFNESNFGDFENKSYEELKDNPDYINWISGDSFSNVCPNGESFIQMKERVKKAFYEIIERHKNSDKDLIIILHSGPIVALMQTLYPNENKSYYDWRIDNGELYKLII